MIEKQVKDLIEKQINDLGVTIDSINYEKENSNYFLRIIIDSEDGIDIDKCVEVTKVVNKLLDEKDFITDSYTLEIWSKERGEQ